MLRVEIRWIDSGAAYENGWESQEAILRAAKLSEVSTVGWLIGEDDFAYFVCTSYDASNETFFGTQVIAKPAVTSVTRLRARTVSATDQEDDQEDSGAATAGDVGLRVVPGLRP